MKRNNKQRSNTADSSKKRSTSNKKGGKSNSKARGNSNQKGGGKQSYKAALKGHGAKQNPELQKVNQQTYYKKNLNKFEEYFPENKGQQQDDDDNFMFNKAPVLKKNEKIEMSKTQQDIQRKKKKQLLKEKLKKQSKIVELDSDEDPITYSVGKKQMYESDMFGDEDDNEVGETFFKSMKYDFTSYFMLNKSEMDKITKVPKMKIKEGAYVLGAVHDKGPSERYLEINLGRSTKAYITNSETCENNTQHNLKEYQIGEYVQAIVVPSLNPQKLQLSLQPSRLNHTLNFEDIFVGMVLQGTIASEEDFGYKINFFTKDRCIGFLKISDDCPTELSESKCYMFTVQSKDDKKKVLQVSLLDKEKSPKLDFDDGEQLLGLDLSNLVKPGNLANCIVTKVLENGLIVKFSKVFFGYIFEDYLQEPLESYKVKQKFRARIIMADIPNKQINLSTKKEHVEMTEKRENENNFFKVGQIFNNGYTVKKGLYGGSYLVTLKNEGGQEIDAYIHTNHVHKDDQEKLKEGIHIKRQVQIKEMNYFEHYPVITSMQQQVKQNDIQWADIKVGETYKGTIAQISQSNEQYRLLVTLSESVKGILEHIHLNDVPTKNLPKNIKEGRKINVRVLSINRQEKKLKFTMKPSLMLQEEQEDENNNDIITNLEDIKIGKAYNGYITKAMEFGFFVSFFNNISGVLSFKDLEEINKVNRKQFKIGQTVQVYVTYVNLDEKKIGLSYSQKGVNNYQISNQSHKNINKTLQNVTPLSQADPSFKSDISNINIGETYDYIVDKKQSESLRNYLILKYKTKDSGEKSHKAIVLLQHMSDYAEHYEHIFAYLKNSLSNPKVKGIVIGKLDAEKGYVLVSLKPCLMENDQKIQSVSDLKKGDQVFAYADYQTSSGIIVKINENFKGFAQINQKSKNEEGQEQENDQQNMIVNMGDSLMLNVRKIDGEKLYFTVSKKVQMVNSQLKYKPFIGYLKEEFLINRKHINQQVKKWQKYKIGNYVSAKVSLIKEYGVILNIAQEAGASNITGFITNDNLEHYQKKNLKLEQTIICQILDVDYEKDILDLVSVQDNKENQDKIQNLSYNLDLAKKQNLSQQLKCKVVLKKDAYSIAKTEQGFLVLVESKSLNEQNQQDEDQENEDSEEEDNKIENNKQLNLKVINTETFGKNIQDINAFNKVNYLPITEIVPIKKEKMELEGGEEKQEKSNKEKQSSEEKSLEKALKGIKAQLKVGGIVNGKVKNVKPTFITVELAAGVVAKLHKSQLDQNDKKIYKQGDDLKAKILNIKKDVHLQIDLTTLKEHMSLPEEKLNERMLIPENEEEFLNQFSTKTIKGVIKSVNTNSIHPLYVEFSNSHIGNVACFDGLVDFSKKDLNLGAEIEKIKNLRKTYKPGQILNFYIKECPNIRNIEASLVKPQPALDVGSIRIAKVCGQNTRKVRVQLDAQIFGEVDIVEVSDDWLANPLQKYKKNDLVPVRVLQENVRGEFDCSMRESVLNIQNWDQALSPITGTTLNFKKLFNDQQNNGDVRSRLYKLGQGSLKTGMLVIGYVNECNKNGCYIKVAFNLSVRAQLNDLSDEYIPNPQAYFYKNKLVIARVIKVKEDGKVDVSLRESVIQYGYSLDITKLKTGLTVEGIVTEHKKGKAVLQLQKCKYKAKLSKKDHEIPDDKQTAYFEVILPKGSIVKAKIKSLKLEPYVKIALTTQKKHFENDEEENQINDEEKEDIKQLIQSIKEISAQNVEQEKKSRDIQISLQQQQQEEEFEGQDEEEEDSDEDMEQEELLNQYAYKDNAEQESGDSQSAEEFEEEFDEEDEDEEEEIDSEDIKSEQSAMEDEDDEEISNKKKSKRQKELIKRKREEKIREKEQRLLNEDAIPESLDDYEKLILKNPNSSFVWIKYMAFSMGQKGIEGARQTAERALKVINFRNETEKLNVWTAFMNLEHNFGTEKQLISIFQRATQQCKPKLVYFRLLDIYKKSEKYDLLFELAKTMIKKFKHSSKVWLEYMKTISEIKSKQQDSNDNQFDLKEILKRSLQCLKKKKHIIIMSHYARLMFIHNEPEKGRTTFDAILSNYPKRTDIWSVFLDMESKYGTQQTTRNLFDRCISMEFKPRQMKFFFKRYLQFELQHGNTEKAEAVKEKAQDYVRSLISSGQIDGQDAQGIESEDEEQQQQQQESGNEQEEEDNENDDMEEEE